MQVVNVSNHVVSVPFTGAFALQGTPTNTYIVMDDGQALIVDVGTHLPQSLDELANTMSLLGVQQVIGVVATHYHIDHTEGLEAVAERFGAPAYLHPNDWKAYHADEKRPAVTRQLVQPPERLIVGELALRIMHVPGHTRGHLHVLVPDDRVVLVGDHLAGSGSVWIGPPDGNMADYYQALTELIALHGWRAAPGHGQVLMDAAESAMATKSHRLQRELQILSLLQAQPETVAGLMHALYDTWVPQAVRWAAERTILGHLEHLESLGSVVHDGLDLTDRVYRRVP